MLIERSDFAKKLSIADKLHPSWDKDYLTKLGFTIIEVDTEFGPRVIQKRPITAQGNKDADMFVIVAEKN